MKPSENISTQSSVDANIESIIRGALFLLEKELTDKLEDVQRSDSLIKIGEKTDLVNSIEALLKNPLDSLYNNHKQVSVLLKDLVNAVIMSYFRHCDNVIHSVYASKTNEHHLFYNIVLKEDSFENREHLLKFFEHYDLWAASQGCPVYFQFVPIELVDSIPNITRLDYAETFKSGKA